MKEKTFYKMLAEIHNEISEQACGCMGYDYTSERVERDDKNESDYNNPEKVINGRTYPKYIPSDKPLDYLGNIIRTYIKIKKGE